MLAVAAGLLATSVPGASAATCNIRGKERKLGASYVTRVTVSGVSCSTGLRLVRAFHACRKRSGGIDGRCRSSVLGYRCTERRGARSSTQYDSSVSCRSGSRRVNHRYTQFI